MDNMDTNNIDIDTEYDPSHKTTSVASNCSNTSSIWDPLPSLYSGRADSVASEPDEPLEELGSYEPVQPFVYENDQKGLADFLNSILQEQQEEPLPEESCMLDKNQKKLIIHNPATFLTAPYKPKIQYSDREKMKDFCEVGMEFLLGQDQYQNEETTEEYRSYVEDQNKFTLFNFFPSVSEFIRDVLRAKKKKILLQPFGIMNTLAQIVNKNSVLVTIPSVRLSSNLVSLCSCILVKSQI
ncbi:hypothetical protein K501DRAFT_268599 [Backusella circina FSU 941]|nr:hypothetical protein K501DRAFT_268599 [Backusella circina FSU 941]